MTRDTIHNSGKRPLNIPGLLEIKNKKLQYEKKLWISPLCRKKIQMPKRRLFIMSGEFPFIAYQVIGGCIGVGSLGANFQEFPFTLEI